MQLELLFRLTRMYGYTTRAPLFFKESFSLHAFHLASVCVNYELGILHLCLKRIWIWTNINLIDKQLVEFKVDQCNL